MQQANTAIKQKPAFGTIEYWKERINKATDLTIIGTNISQNKNWDKGHYNYFEIHIVIDGKIEELRFTNNETKKNLQRLPVKQRNGLPQFYEHVLGENRFFSILYSLSRVLFEGDNSVNNDAGYVIFEKFPSARNHN